MKLIGQGENWKVYKLHKDSTEHLVFRIPINGSDLMINKYISNYIILKGLSVSILNLVECTEIDGTKGVLTEDLNSSDDKIYVTHNSLYSDLQKEIDSLNPYISETKKSKKSPEAEEFRYRNKLNKIIGFKIFLDEVKIDLEIFTKNNILVEFDTYFFGTQKMSSISTIDYMLVDLDHIFIHDKEKKDNLFNLNLSEFIRAITGFIKYFVSENKRAEYFSCLFDFKQACNYP